MARSLRHNRLAELLAVDYPILQAPMAGASNPDLVAAVSNAGGLGALGAAAMSPAQLQQSIAAIRQQTDRPFNINLFARSTEVFAEASQPGEGFKTLLQGYHDEMGLGELPTPKGIFGPMDAQLAVLLEAKVPVISLHFGIEADIVDMIHNAGSRVLCSATTVTEAVALEQLGVDAIIAQGAEAGGHRGTFMHPYQEALIGTMALVPQVVDAVSVPVIAAGGLMDARGIRAATALGAEGAQLGTAFLACPETGLTAAWRDNLITSSPQATTVTTALSGKPARGLRNRYISEVEQLDEEQLPYPLHYSMSGPLRKAATQADNPDFLAMWSGQGVGMIRQVPAAELMSNWITDLEAGD